MNPGDNGTGDDRIRVVTSNRALELAEYPLVGGTAWLEMVGALAGTRVRDSAGKEGVTGLNDLLVVAPYNAQVNRLKEHLPPNARVGTIDKFQGQEAPVCLISMATSSGDELPRDIAFLFSTNRLNVAVSRAQALAVVFASPRLLDVPCSTIERMKLANALCALREQAHPLVAAAAGQEFLRPILRKP